MRIRWIGALGLLTIAAAACTTVWFVSVLKPTSAGAFVFFTAWLVSPHVAMAAVLALLARRGGAATRWSVIAIIVSIGGIVFLADLIFWHTDAQGALAVLMAPLFQAVALAVLWALSLLVGPAASQPPPSSRP